MTDVTIRNARLEDAVAIHAHMRDFAEFEKLLDSFTATADELKEAIFAADTFINCLVAETDGSIQGYAIFFPYFSSFRSRSGFYLEDLYVAPAARGKQIGHRLLETIAKLAADRGFSRIDLQVLDWNLPAIEFYKARGARTNSDERRLVFDGEAFESLAVAVTN